MWVAMGCFGLLLIWLMGYTLEAIWSWGRTVTP
jgi:hypothetical protein